MSTRFAFGVLLGFIIFQERQLFKSTQRCYYVTQIFSHFLSDSVISIMDGTYKYMQIPKKQKSCISASMFQHAQTQAFSKANGFHSNRWLYNQYFRALLSDQLIMCTIILRAAHVPELLDLFLLRYRIVVLLKRIVIPINF